jgi:hypothetical protein
MARATLKDNTLEVHRVVGEATKVNTAYGAITVPRNHYIIYFPGQFELATALPPETFDDLFENLEGDETEDLPEAPALEPPSDEDINAWVEAHYVETYRAAVATRLFANRERAAELLAKYPLPEEGAEPAATPPVPVEEV